MRITRTTQYRITFPRRIHWCRCYPVRLDAEISRHIRTGLLPQEPANRDSVPRSAALRRPLLPPQRSTLFKRHPAPRLIYPGAGPVDLVAKNVISNISPDVASGKNKNTSDHTGVPFFPNAAHIGLPHRFFSLFRSGVGLGRTGTMAYSRATPPFRAETARSTFMKRTSLTVHHRHSRS